MPQIEFDAMPSSARVWVFGAAAPVMGAARDALFTAVDQHLAAWNAHGTPLVCARDWRDDRFLAIAVDEAATGASGCSIDGLFRVLSRVESTVGAAMLEGSLVFWRDANKTVHAAPRSEFRSSAAQGTITESTHVFDTTVNSVGAWREKFEREAGASWHGSLLPR